MVGIEAKTVVNAIVEVGKLTMRSSMSYAYLIKPGVKYCTGADRYSCKRVNAKTGEDRLTDVKGTHEKPSRVLSELVEFRGLTF